jgi:hypothetical protein
MLERTPSTLEMPAPSTAPVYRGKDLARQARRGNATERALLAVEIAGATVTLTSQLATALTHANHTYVAALRGVTELERAGVKAGDFKLSDRCNRHRKPISDVEFDALVIERAERALAVLDQLTSQTVNCEPVNHGV